MISILKQFIFPFFVTLSISLFGQIPSGYYNSASGLTGSDLKTALYNIIKNPNVDSYDNLWDDFEQTDKKSDGTVWDIYSNYTFHFTSDQCGSYSSEGDCYNREHSFPKSWFNDASPMYSDLFHIYPTDGYVNGQRSNLPYGEVGTATYTSSNGCKKGNNVYGSYTGTVFEPADEYKGDIARTYFYMVTCYENLVASWESNQAGADAMLNGTSFPAFENWSLQMLMDWNTQDPVSQKEIDRNNAVYNIQGNRNPYIDHPEFVCLVWGNNCPNNLISLNQNPEEITISYQNNEISILCVSDALNTENIHVYDTLGQIIAQKQTTVYEGNWNISIPLSDANNGHIVFVTVSTNKQHFISQKIFVPITSIK